MLNCMFEFYEIDWTWVHSLAILILISGLGPSSLMRMCMGVYIESMSLESLNEANTEAEVTI